MAFEVNKEFDLNRILSICNIRPGANRIEDSKLKKIFDSYIKNAHELEIFKLHVLDVLNTNLSDKCHSIRCRVKDPDHLVGKLIRNYHANWEKYKDISEKNYYKIVTDLVAARIIVLRQQDWKEVHKILLELFENDPNKYSYRADDILKNYDKFKYIKGKELSYHAEKPKVYIMSNEDRTLYADDNLDIISSGKHYRSIHYIIRYNEFYFEIQVRTLFEEGWLEFDHLIKYPNDQTNKKKQEYADILSSIAVAADRLISFYDDEKFPSNDSDPKGNNLNTNISDAPAIDDSQNNTLDDDLRKLF